MAKGPYFRKIDINLLEKRLEEKVPVSKIAAEIGCSKVSVYKYIKSRGLDMTPAAFDLDPEWLREQKKLGRTDSEIADEFGVWQATICKLRDKYGIEGLPASHPKCRRPKQEIEPEWLREQKELRRTDAEIGKELGCSARTVLRRRRELGISAY